MPQHMPKYFCNIFLVSTYRASIEPHRAATRQSSYKQCAPHPQTHGCVEQYHSGSLLSSGSLSLIGTLFWFNRAPTGAPQSPPVGPTWGPQVICKVPKYGALMANTTQTEWQKRHNDQCFPICFLKRGSKPTGASNRRLHLRKLTAPLPEACKDACWRHALGSNLLWTCSGRKCIYLLFYMGPLQGRFAMGRWKIIPKS